MANFRRPNMLSDEDFDCFAEPAVGEMSGNSLVASVRHIKTDITDRDYCDRSQEDIERVTEMLKARVREQVGSRVVAP